MKRQKARPRLRFEHATNALGCGLGEVGFARVGHFGRQIEQGLLSVAKMRRDDEFAGFSQAEPLANVLEATLHGERGGGEDDGGDGFEDQFAQEFRDIDGRGLEKCRSGSGARASKASLRG